MNPQQAEKIILDIRERIERFNDEYYQLGQSSIEDDAFDVMLEQLVRLEDQFPQFDRADSPSKRVGGGAVNDFKQVDHRHPMLSLDNLYSQDDLSQWFQGLRKQLKGEPFNLVCELKIDGFAVAVRYSEGKIAQAVTRGNGETGDDVTSNVKTIKTLPMGLAEKLSLEVRGEIFLPKSRFDQINLSRAREEQDLFKNPRNAAAGSIRMKNPKEVAKRGLDIFLYDLVEGPLGESHFKNLLRLRELGLQVTPHFERYSEIEGVMAFCSRWEGKKESLPFEIDGVVIKIDSLSQRKKLGVTLKSPRWAVAWKFKSEKVKSRLRGIENSIGRTGILTPVALLTPVELLGTEVKRATLHNYAQIERLGIHEGDLLFVEKGGEIIPKIVGVDYTQRPDKSSPVKPPDRCPSCGTVLVKLPAEVDLRCPKTNCPAVVQGQIEHFVSKKAMDIRSLGSSILKSFIHEGLIDCLPDLYRLHQKKEALLKLEGFGEKSVEKLFSAIQKSKNAPLNQFIYGLGIRHIGEKASKALARRFKTVETLLEIPLKEWEEMKDFGPVMQKSLHEWLSDEKNRQTIQELSRLGLSPQTPKTTHIRPFEGKRIVLTGSLSKPREEWKEVLEENGFSISSSISKNTDYLLVGEKPGSKLTKAKNLGIAVLSEEEISQLIQSSTE